MDTMILTNSAASLNRVSNSLPIRYPVSFISMSQYRVSFASLRAMLSLLIKSAVDCACSLSKTNAPTAVPLRKHCCDKTYSLFLFVTVWYILTMRTANLYDFSLIMFSFIMSKYFVQ